MYHSKKSKKRALLAALACIVLSGTHAHPTHAQNFAAQDVYDLILEVKRERKVIAPAIIGLEKGENRFLPVLELARIMDFKADADIAAGRVTGFYIAPDNTFTIDVKNGTYTVKGNTSPLPENSAFTFEQAFGLGDIYVTTDLLNQIWPLNLKLNHLNLSLEIQTDKKLPYELKSQRQRDRDRALNRGNKNTDTIDTDGLTIIKNDYKRLSLPALDVSTSINWRNETGDHTETVNFNGGNDFLHTRADYNFRFKNSNDETPSLDEARLTFTKQSYEEGDLPLGLKLFQAGDVSSQTSGLIDGSIRGRGILLTTAPNKQARNFDTIIVEGTADPGWEVELYRNSELLEFTTVDSSGEYRFEDVTLNYNQTTIRTVLYGPQGQVEERTETYNISKDMLKPGKTIFEASILEDNKDFIPTDDDSQVTGLAQNYKASRGINKWSSAFATFTDTPTIGGDKRYATLGLNLSFLGVSGLIEGYKNLTGGSALDVRMATSFAGANVNLRTSFLKDFESDSVGFGDNAETFKAQAIIDKTVKIFKTNLGLRLNIDHERYKDRDSRTQIDLTQTYAVKGLRLTHGTTTSLLNKEHNNTTGRFNANYNINKNWNLRSFLNYDYYPNPRLRNVLGELRYRDGKRLTAAIDVDRNLLTDGTNIGTQLGYEFDQARTSIDLDWGQDTGATALLRTSFSLTPYGKDRSYVFSGKNLANKASLDANIFIDRDYDGTYSEGDEPLKDARIQIANRESKDSSADGHIQYQSGGSTEYEPVTFAPKSVDNPFLIPAKSGYKTLIRPGIVPPLDFPLVETGTIDGTLSHSDGALATVRIQLLSGDGVVIDTTTTAFDGYYTFEYVRPGNYIVQVDPSYDQVYVPPRLVSVTSEDLFQFGMDLQILEQAEEAACVENYETGEDGRVTHTCYDAPSTQNGIVHPAPLLSTDQPFGGTQSEVIGVRIGEYADKVRLTLDLSEPTTFRVLEQNDQAQIIVELPATTWAATRTWQARQSQIVDNFEVVDTNNGVQLKIKANDHIVVADNALLGPNGSKGHRLYFDIKK